VKGKNKDQMSFGEIRQMVCDAICAKEGKDFSCYIEDIFPDSVVYESMGPDNMMKCYQRSYSIAEGEVTLGDAVEVQKEISYTPMKAACVLMAATEGDDTGAKWQVKVIEFGPDKNGVNWDKAVLTAALPMFEGAKVFALNDSQHQDPKTASRFGKSPRELIGALTAAVIKSDGIYADLVIMPSAAWLQQDLKACEEFKIPYVYGLSVDVSAKTKKVMVAGKAMIAPETIKAVQVDVVYDPAAGGKFIQMAAAVEAGQEEEQDMLKKLLAAIQGKNPTLFAQITAAIAAGTMKEEDAITAIAAATVKENGGDDKNTTLVAAVVSQLTAAFAADPGKPEGSDTLKEMKLMACGMKLDTMLAASLLPEAAQTKIRNQFKDQVFEDSALQAAIKDTKELLDEVTGSGRVTAAGRVTYESSDKLQAAFDQMFRVQVDSGLATVPAFTSLRAAYVEMTGDTDVTGVITPQNARRLQAAYGDTTFAYALGNTLYRRVAQDYREIQDYGVSRLVGNNIRNARDFRKLETMLIGYYGDLPTVNTDTDDYPDLGEVGDEMVEYALMEQGGIITIKRKTIINDDLRLVDKIISRLGRGARRGVARKVWTPFLTNANYKGDNKAIFHADHGNLGSAAYAIASALAAKTAMAQQKEQGSNERLLLRPVTVSYPSELFGIVSNVNTFRPQAVSVDNGNSMFGFFKDDGLFENPFMTDANNWMMFADPNEIEIVELAYLNGQQEPQMFIANNPTQGQMFVNGGIQYKIQHDYNAEVIDFRGAYGAVVA
jgi:hypothetical protein